MKKKILVMALAVILAVTAITGISLAYLTDDDAAENVFTIGKIDITLNDEFVQKSLLMPGVDVSKKVSVSVAEDSQPAYVRVHIAIPQILDTPNNAGANILHFNMSKASFADGLWSWDKTGENNYPGNEGDWNFYTVKIDNIWYNVYVVTYESVLTAGQTTAENAIHKVYMDKGVTSDQLVALNEALNGDWTIKVVAEGVQAASFTNAYEALNAAFGVPGTYSIEWPEYSEN